MPSPADPSQPPARVLLNRPSAAARDRNSLRAAFEHDETLDVRISGTLPHGDEFASSRVYLRAYTFGVTDEAPGRYTSEPSGELGRGAIGRVYLAEDLHLGRQVAIKELLQGVSENDDGSPALQTVSRFLREARVTGALEHPNIVPVYELGRRADGSLYYTMRVVPGRTLSQAISESSGLNERLALVNHFSGLCQAIAYAHSRGIVHRDIKPDNVMIGEFGETVVLDWGMAKLCADEQVESTTQPPASRLEMPDLGLTAEGSLCGTPLYMSPEQLSGHTADIDQRSDVWSLGVVMYSILAGRQPFSGSSLLELLACVKAGQYTPLRAIDANIPAELAAVVERALRSDKLERYASAREFSRDVQAYQAGMRVAAYEYSSLDLVKRFVAKHRSAVVVSALALVFIFASGFMAYRRVVLARDRALVAEHKALANELSARHNAEQVRHSLGEVLLERAQQALQEGNSVDAELLAARALEQEERSDARGVVIAARSAMRPALSATLAGAKGCARTALSFSAGLFVCATARDLGLWRLGEKAVSLTVPLESEVAALSLAGDASVLAVGLADGALHVRSARITEQPWSTENCGQKPTALAVSSERRVLACGGSGGLVVVFRGAEAWRFELGQAVSALALSTDGSQLLVGGELGALSSYDTEKHTQRRFSGHTGTVLALALTEQGRYLASGAADRMVRFWDTSTGAQTQAPIVHSDAVSTLGWSEDRRFIALGGKDKTFRVLDLRTGRSSLLRQHDEAVELAAISTDGNQLASYSHDVGLRTWSLPASGRPTELTERGNVLALALGADPNQLLSAGLGRNGACSWDLSTGACAARLPVRLDRVRALAVSLDHRHLALAGSGSQIFVWDLAAKIPTQVIEGLPNETRALAFSLDGRTLLAAGLDRKLRAFDVASAAKLYETETTAAIQTLSVAPRTGELVSGDQAGVLTLWDAKSGRPQFSFQAHADWILGSAISPDGAWLASAGADRLVKVWNLPTRKRALTLSGHAGKVMTVDFSPDSDLLASAGEDKSVRLWDPRSGRALATLTGHAGVVRAVRFTQQPDTLASGSDDGAIRLWRLADLTRPARELEEQVTRQFDLAPPTSEGEAKAEDARHRP